MPCWPASDVSLEIISTVPQATNQVGFFRWAGQFEALADGSSPFKTCRMVARPLEVLTGMKVKRDNSRMAGILAV